MMRKREKELEELLAGKTAELQKVQAEIEKLKLEAQEMKKRFEERDAYAQKLQTRESDVVAAFAEIQNTRNRKMKETEETVQKMTADAEQIVANARLEAEKVKTEVAAEMEKLKEEARNEAESVVQKARTDAEEIKTQAETLRADCEKENEKLKLHMASIAQQCRDHIASLEEKVSRLHASKPAEIDTLVVEEKTCVEDPDGETPTTEGEREEENAETADSYENPADLMKSIYEIEKRELPDKDEENAETAPEEPDHVWTVDEIVDSVIDDGKSSEEDYLEKLIGEILQ